MPLTARHLFLAAALIALAHPVGAQPPPPTPEQLAQQAKVRAALDSIAIIEHKVSMPMRDGIRLSTDIYRPKDPSKKYATIFVRTPYNFNWWDVKNGVPRDVTAMYDAVRRGYAYVVQNERGKFFSQGTWDILGPPRTDGYDAIQWITTQPWSNGKLGTLGCSSTAEWQMGVAALGAPGHAAMVPQGFGAGVGRVGPFYEQGNWYRGGAVQMLFIDWLYGEQTPPRPTFPAGMSQQDIERSSRYYDLAPQAPKVDWADAFKHLPEQDIFKAVDGPPGIFADSVAVATGGRMIQRTPNDSAWYRGGLYHDDMPFKVPSLWFMSWYDVSISPNLEIFNHVRKTAAPEIANNQYAVIAPVGHCAYKRATDSTVVGERWVGDARYGYDSLVYSWFDHFLNGADNHLLDTLPKVRYYTMGSNKWQTSESWPPKGASPMTFYLNDASALSSKSPTSADKPDGFTYDPLNPAPTYGGNVCCQPSVLAGSYDQRKVEATRPDILTYNTDAFKEGTEVSGPISVTLYVSSNRKDTDFTVKVIDVYPDGRAYNLDETIQRMRYRDGYDKQVWMEPGKVYKVVLGPMNTSNYFDAGHRIRIEVSSSNFPRFDRNLNTGGHNYDETQPLTAQNAVHHSKQYPSAITVTVVKHPTQTVVQ